ncbi:MAG: hypothetical protein QG597_4244 [Actinomycetota bacterium]|nr:hypothetical protein [Actinomycetota bacterium]
MYRRGIAAGLTCLALAGTLSGCFNGYQAQTTAQQQGGEVASFDSGDVQGRGLIWVRDPAKPDTAYFSGTMLLVQNGQPDELLSVSAAPGGDAALTGAPVKIEPSLPVRIGFNGTHFASVGSVPDEPSPFLNTTLEFKNAGKVDVSVLVVPGVGPYADVVKASKSGSEDGEATASESASPTTSGSPSAAAEAPAAEAPAG